MTRLGRWAAVAAAMGSMVLAAPAAAQVLPLPTRTPTPAPTATPTPTPEPGGPTPTVAPGAAPPVTAPAAATSAVVAGQDAAGSGSSGDAALAGPLGAAWETKLARVSTVVTGGGRVYVAHGVIGSITVAAFDAATGARLWTVATKGNELAYGDGRLAVGALRGDGGVEVLDAATGAAVWRIGGGLGDPLVDGDLVLTRGNGVVSARRLADGGEAWSSNVDGTEGTVGVAGDRVYVDGPCLAHALDRRSGAIIWQATSSCVSGGGGGRPLLWRDRMYARSSGLAGRAAADGAALPGPIPVAVTGDVGLVPVVDRTMGTRTGFTAVRLPGGQRLWRAARTQTAVGLPGAVFTLGFTGTLAVRDAGTGAVRWSGRLEAPREPQTVPGPSRVVAGEGRVFVVTATGLVALGPRAAVPPLRVTPPSAGIGVSGRPFGVRWRVRGPLAPALGVEARDGRRWWRIGTARPGAKRTVSIGITSRRNGVIRLVGPDLAAPVVVPVYIFAPLRTRLTQAGGVVSARVQLGRVPGLRRAGRRVAEYLRRGGSRTYRRLGTARLDRTGRGVIRFRALRRVGARDVVATCLVGARRDRLGPPDPLTRRCGARRVTFPR